MSHGNCLRRYARGGAGGWGTDGDTEPETPRAMIIVRGTAGGTELTGTIYERGEEAPSFSGSPDEEAAYVWICDEFYEVDSGGSTQTVDGREIRIAFESPLPRGFDTKEQAVEAAKEHVRTQFARIGIDSEAVEIETSKGEFHSVDRC